LNVFLHLCLLRFLDYIDFYEPGNLGSDLQNILGQSYDNAKVTIDLRRTSNFTKRPTKDVRLFLGTIHLQTCKIFLDSVRKLAYDIPKRNFSTFQVTIESRSYDKLTTILRVSCSLVDRLVCLSVHYAEIVFQVV